ncbi:MAG TPA: hypothetical protein VIM25_01300 [Candidatus Limnocylindrales bacterium]
MSSIGTIDGARQLAQGLTRALLIQSGGTGRIDGRGLGLIQRALNDSPSGALADGTLVSVGGTHTVLGNIVKVTTPDVTSFVVGITLGAIGAYQSGDILTLGLHPAVLSIGTINVGDLLYPSSTPGYVTATRSFGSVPLGYAVTTASGTSTVAVWFDPTPAGFSLDHALLQGVAGLNRHANLNEGAATFTGQSGMTPGILANLHDRSDTTYALLGGSAPHFVQVSLGYAQKATAARLLLGRANSGSTLETSTGCTIDGSNDGSTWTNLWTGDLLGWTLGHAAYENIITWAAPSIAYSYYRVVWPTSMGDDTYIYDWALYEAAGETLYVNSGGTAALLDTVIAGLGTAIPAGTYETASGGGAPNENPLGTVGATATINPASGNIATLTLGANCTITLTAPADATRGCTLEAYVIQDGTGSRLVTWPGSVVWPGGTAPTLSTAAGSVDRIILETLDGGTTWYGVMVGGGTALGIATPLVESGTGVAGTAAAGSHEDHVHPAAGASSTLHEVVMQSGTSSPPVPIWNSAGDDYVYSS